MTEPTQPPEPTEQDREAAHALLRDQGRLFCLKYLGKLTGHDGFCDITTKHIATTRIRAHAEGRREATEEVEFLVLPQLRRIAESGELVEWGFKRGSRRAGRHTCVSWKCHACGTEQDAPGACQLPGCNSFVARETLSAIAARAAKEPG